MNRNYRSGENIIRLANTIASNMKFQSAEIKGFGKKDKVSYQRFPSSKEEAISVVDNIMKLLKYGVKPDDIGIIYRTNACASLYEINLATSGIRYRSKSGDGFFGSRVVRDILAYLTSAITEHCESSLSRIINRPNRYLGNIFISHWEKYLDQGISPKNALLKQYDKSYWEKSASELYYHLEMISRCMFECRKAISYVRQQVGYDNWLLTKSEGGADKSKQDLLNELEYISTGHETIDSLLNVARETAKFEATRDAVTLMTIHGSKGLEFKHVFFVSLNQGIIPHIKASTEKEIEEERRMFYVGVTRAAENLYLSSYMDKHRKSAESAFVLECTHGLEGRE